MEKKVIAYAIQVFGNNIDLAMDWLNAFNPALQDAPIRLLNSDEGCDLVLNVLYCIEDKNLSCQ